MFTFFRKKKKDSLTVDVTEKEYTYEEFLVETETYFNKEESRAIRTVFNYLAKEEFEFVQQMERLETIRNKMYKKIDESFMEEADEFTKNMFSYAQNRVNRAALLKTIVNELHDYINISQIIFDNHVKAANESGFYDADCNK